MDDATLAELEVLRVRAYGPAADIAADPAALARLRELEAGLRATIPAPAPAPAPAPVSASVGARAPELGLRDRFAAVPVPQPVSPVGADSAPADAAEADPDAADPPLADAPESTVARDAAASRGHHRSRWIGGHRRLRRIAVLWPLSVVATAVVTYGVLVGLPGRSSLTEAKTLTLTEGGVAQDLFGTGTEPTLGASFHGLTIVKSTNVFGGPGVVCLVAFRTSSDPGGFEGPMYTGCAGGALPATVQVGVDAVSPAALRSRYPDGTGLRFVLDGNRVHVFVDSTAAQTPGA